MTLAARIAVGGHKPSSSMSVSTRSAALNWPNLTFSERLSVALILLADEEEEEEEEEDAGGSLSSVLKRLATNGTRKSGDRWWRHDAICGVVVVWCGGGVV